MLFFKMFLFRRDLVVVLYYDILSEEFFLVIGVVDFLEGILGVVDEVFVECVEIDLDEGMVVENLVLDVEVGDVFLEMGYEYYVMSFVVFVVEGEEVYLVEYGVSMDNVFVFDE